MPSRIPKSATQEFTKISTPAGTYELWNSLTAEQEATVIERLGLEQGSLPLSKKDEQRQRLLFGKGQFGRVRLAQKNGRFLAVKKITVAPAAVPGIIREYNFGRFLQTAKIPNVAYGSEYVITANVRGENTCYLFMETIASLGNGDNLKRLLSYIPSGIQRNAVLRHTTYSLLKAVASMHEQQIYHRDIKASNILVSSSGEIYLSDFGSARVGNKALISQVLKQDVKEFAVSHNTDRRYFSHEVAIAIAQNKVIPPTSIPADALLDNWRLGLTILQLCGAVKEYEGILSAMFDSKNADGSVNIGWLSEIKRRGGGQNLEVAIKGRFEEELEKIKTEAINKVPIELQQITLGLLELDPEKRLSAPDALKFLDASQSVDMEPLEKGIQSLVQAQVAVNVKNSIRKALREEASQAIASKEWLKDALSAFKTILRNPKTTAQQLQDFVNYWIINPKNRPSFTLEHYEAALIQIRKKIERTQARLDDDEKAHDVWHNDSREGSDDHYGEMRSGIAQHEAIDPVEHEGVATGSHTPIEPEEVDKDSPYGFMPTSLDFEEMPPPPPPTSGDYASVEKVLGDLAAAKLKQEALAKSKTRVKQYLAPPPVTTSEDPELNRLEDAFRSSSDDLMDYVKSKRRFGQPIIKELEGIIHSMMSGFNRIKELLTSKPLEISHPEPASGSVDEGALKAVFARTEQIISQLTLGKIMQLKGQEVAAVSHMLIKDKQFLESLADKMPNKYKIEGLLDKINEKMELLDKISKDQQVYTSTHPLDFQQFLKHEPESRTYVAQNHETKTRFTFTESKARAAYKLPSPLTDAVRSFIAKRTIKEPNKAHVIHIYSSKEDVAKSVAQAILQLDYNNKDLKVYVNDQLISRTTQKKLFGFFGENTAPRIVDQSSKFTVEEVLDRGISFQNRSS